jgi:hypothetical protein
VEEAMTAALDDLSRAAARYGTDKGFGDGTSRAHGYTHRYDQLLAPLRPTARSVLEIGVLWGASLLMWRDYFPAAQILGVDIDLKTALGVAVATCGERIQVMHADARDPGVRQQLVALGPFDLVVDDASHEFELMRDLALTLLPHANIYIIEDVTARDVDISRLSRLDQSSLLTVLQPVAGLPEILVSRIPGYAALIYDRRKEIR